MKVLFSEPTHIGPQRFVAGEMATLEESAQLIRAIECGWASEVKPEKAPEPEAAKPKVEASVAPATEEPSAPKRSRKRRKNSGSGSSAS